MKLKKHSNTKRVPEVLAGVYFLILDEEVVYVGQSSNIHMRLQSHINQDVKLFDDAWYISEKDKPKRLYLEMNLIQMYKPIYNVVTNSFLKKPK